MSKLTKEEYDQLLLSFHVEPLEEEEEESPIVAIQRAINQATSVTDVLDTVNALTPPDKKRLKTNREKVKNLMMDNQWHPATEIREVGGAEGLRRLRELRKDGYVVTKRRIKEGRGSFEYRVCGWIPWGE